MLNRNTPRPPSDQLPEPPGVIVVELIQQGQPSDLDPGHERQQESGVLSRRWDSGLAQLIRCLGQ
jgi:hypothetical protein